MNSSTGTTGKPGLLFILRNLVLFSGVGFLASLGAIPVASAPKPANSAQNSSPDESQTYDGMITDTHCGAKHSAAIGLAAAECTRVCVHAGQEFALVDGDKVFVLTGDREALKRVAGQRAKIVGTLNGNTISVSSVVAGK